MLPSHEEKELYYDSHSETYREILLRIESKIDDIIQYLKDEI